MPLMLRFFFMLLLPLFLPAVFLFAFSLLFDDDFADADAATLMPPL